MVYQDGRHDERHTWRREGFNRIRCLPIFRWKAQPYARALLIASLGKCTWMKIDRSMTS